MKPVSVWKGTRLNKWFLDEWKKNYTDVKGIADQGTLDAFFHNEIEFRVFGVSKKISRPKTNSYSTRLKLDFEMEYNDYDCWRIYRPDNAKYLTVLLLSGLTEKLSQTILSRHSSETYSINW